ncbi:FKBP-type peptidyl-prolyl cis-trans isomerase [Tsukamurella pseudospumae]|uniref:Peptidyl-prolyl cis-trans isomerase n=1 Tax=Tsukamurella pseudospumae TaxID=239498 RepID=A0A137YYW3_9ACTN|nr:FKBP-type peptidyl-prolyl cis-trans isomerase [Tsukamurella pseudospumae]KXO91132.1 hypothetical protein AXK61_06040 [Tsukamurella pseudospumae]
MDTPFARLTAAAAASAAIVVIAGCGATSEQSAATSSRAHSIDACPSSAPTDDARAITLRGVTGSASVVAPTADSAPRITVTAPFQVDRLQAETARAGTGQTVTEKSVVTLCYQGVNGRTGEVFDDAFARATSAEMALPDLVPGFRAALVGQKAGAAVVAAIPAAQAYPKGEPDAGIAPGDSLVFAISVIASNS